MGEDDRCTLENIKEGKIDLEHSLLKDISEDGRDFLSKCLERDPAKRMDVKTALQHPWLRLGDVAGTGPQLSCIDNLRDYHKKWKNWVRQSFHFIIKSFLTFVF